MAGGLGLGMWDWLRHIPGLGDPEQLENRLVYQGPLPQVALIPNNFYKWMRARGPTLRRNELDQLELLAGKLNDVDLVDCDMAVRIQDPWDKPANPDHVLQVPAEHTNCLGIFSFDRSGYVRETAVRRLAESTDARAIPFLLIRLNDWAEPVRAVALGAIADRVRPEFAWVFLRHLGLLIKLLKLKRWDHGEVIRQVSCLLVTGPTKQAFLELTDSPERAVRRSIFTFIAGGVPREELGGPLLHCMKSGDEVIRAMATRLGRKVLEQPGLGMLLDSAVEDSFEGVRREGIFGLAERSGEIPKERLRPFLFDSSSGVRSTARFYLQKAGETDVLQQYVRLLGSADSKELKIAITGVAAIGGRSEIHLLTPFAKHPLPAIRRTALRGMSKLAEEEAFDFLWAALADPEPAVRRQAFKLLGESPRVREPGRLRSTAADTAQPTFVRESAVHWMDKLTWWDRATALTEVMVADDKAIVHIAEGYLDEWGKHHGQLMSKPTIEQLDAIEGFIRDHGTRLQRSTRIMISESARSARALYYGP